MSGWTLVRAEDFIDFNPHESLPRNTLAKKIAMECLQPFTRDISDFKLAPFSGGSKFRNGDTIMARITPCLENGKTAQISILEDDELGFGSTEFIVLRPKPGVSDKDFVYYLSISPILRARAIKSMVGSSGRQRVQQSVLNNIQFYAPSLPEQSEIGRTLRALDDKIANNSKINHHFKPLNDMTLEYLYCYLKAFDYQALGNTSSIATAVNSKTIKAMPFIMPDKKVLTDFHAATTPLFEQVRVNLAENTRLAALRDALLPRLMSGKLSVADLGDAK